MKLISRIEIDHFRSTENLSHLAAGCLTRRGGLWESIRALTWSARTGCRIHPRVGGTDEAVPDSGRSVEA